MDVISFLLDTEDIRLRKCSKMIDASKVYNPSIFIFRNNMYAWVVRNNALAGVQIEVTPDDTFIATAKDFSLFRRFALKDILIFRGSVELNMYIETHPLEDKLYIIPIDIQEFVINALNDIILLDDEYWVSEFGCRNIEEVFKQHNYLGYNGRLAVQVGSDINNIPLSLNILFDTLGNLDSVEIARKVIDDIDDLCD